KAIGEFQAPVNQLSQSVKALSEFGQSVKALSSGLEAFNSSARALAGGLKPFNEAALKLAQSLDGGSIPSVIQLQSKVDVDARITGAAVIAAVKGDIARELTNTLLEKLGPEIKRQIDNQPVRA